MSTGSKQRNKQQRIDNLGIDKGWLDRWSTREDKTRIASRLGLAAAAAVALLVICRSWTPPFAYREGAIPARDLITRVSFEVPDIEATRQARQRRRESVEAYYRHSTKPLDQLQARLRDQLFLIADMKELDEAKPASAEAFAQFRWDDPDAEPPMTPEEQFAALRSILGDDPKLTEITKAVRQSLAKPYETGTLQSIQHEATQGSQQAIWIYPVGNPDDRRYESLSNVRIAQLEGDIRRRLSDEFRRLFSAEHPRYRQASQMVAQWIVSHMPEFETLTYDEARTREAAEAAADEVEPVLTRYESGRSVLAPAGQPITAEQLKLLRLEWSSLTERMRIADHALRVAAYTGMLGALFLVCGSYIWFVDDRRLLLELPRLARLLAVAAAVVGGGYWLSGWQLRTEYIALTMGSILATVVYGRELALSILVSACFAMALFLGSDIAELVATVSAVVACVLLLGRIRTRTRLFNVGAIASATTILTVMGVGIVTGHSLSAASIGDGIEPIYRGPIVSLVMANLAQEALWSGFWIIVSSAAMTALLPYIERGFEVQTDLSLLELGDASHQLLRKLAQRAPGTYNHSINVASIAEAAADAINANGLLVRVGAYFHDIGKMFKPDYFIENQTAGKNTHDALQPAMSTLVIIAHVKDGADLARSHNLPQPIIDLILQHHGTTLVEYFFREAARRSEDNPDAGKVADKDFRYPGPKPQTLEAAVMMLADTVESASRTLVDPTPARIRHLIDQIADKKVSDGQFDECGLTFAQLADVKDSLVKSVTAIYHARIKYPGSQSA